MKTIEEASIECANTYVKGYRDSYPANEGDFIDVFEAGVEFAQRWISVEEELPPIGEMVLTKMEKRHGDTWVQHYYSTATRLENQGEWQDVNWVDHSMSFGHITHWRPIELK